jgi:hypothetical protein
MRGKSNLPRIDDAFDAAKAARPKKPENIPGDLALRVASHMPLLGSLVGVVNETRQYFSSKATNERLEILIEAVNSKVEDLKEEVNDHTQKIADIKSRIDSAAFAAAFREASVQTLFATEEVKIERFGALLGNAVRAEEWPEVSSDLTTFVKTIAQLSEKDIDSLRLLGAVFAEVVKVYPNMHDPNPFTEKALELLKVAGEAGFHRDDFYAHCRRLEGFGLAMEVPRNTSRMAPGDYCFRPTRTGMKLLRLLVEKKGKSHA